MDSEDRISSIFLLLQGKATAEEEAMIRRWIEEDEDHGRIFRETAELYYQLNYATRWSEIDEGRAVGAVKRKLSNRKRRINRWGLLSGMAALFAICLGTFFFMHRTNVPDVFPVAKVEEVKGGEMKAVLTLANGEKVPLGSEGLVNVDLGFGNVVEDSIQGLKYCFKDSVVQPQEQHSLSVPRAGEYIMVLSDGSKVWLNSETELKYPVAFEPDQRVVYLTGEAYFEVVKDAKRPFVVVTPQTRTTVLGTSFNVMAYQGEQHTEITLLTGAVSVRAGNRNCEIIPGQQVAVDNESLDMQRQTVHVSSYTSWKDGLFDFDYMTLSDLCVKLGRWYDVDFFFVNQAAAEKRFTGAIKRNRSLQFMLDFIQKTSGVRFEAKGKTVTVYNN